MNAHGLMSRLIEHQRGWRSRRQLSLPAGRAELGCSQVQVGVDAVSKHRTETAKQRAQLCEVTV